MPLRHFVTGYLSYETAKKPASQDFYFVACTLLVFAVLVGIGVTIYRWWSFLLNNSYSPTPLVLLMATAVYLCWDWTRIARQREQLARWALAYAEDPKFQQLVQQALVNLYRGSFLMCMLVLLLMMTLNLLVRVSVSP